MKRLTFRAPASSWRFFLVFAAAVGGPVLGWSSATAAEGTSAIHVSESHDNKAFDYQMTPLSRTDAFTVWRLTYPSPVVTSVPQNNTIPADYYLPRGIQPGDPKRPAVICLHILDGNFELEQMLCSSLASRGIPALMFKLPYYGERSLPGGPRALLANPKLFVEALPQGVADVRRTVDVLASRGEIDPGRISISGISLGGLVAATAAAEEPRLARAALILAGGDLPAIIDHAREARALKEFLAGLSARDRADVDRMIRSVDPLNHAAGLRGRAQEGRVIMFNAAEDEVIPKACTTRLAEALGMPDRVVWFEGLGHYTAMAALPRILAATVEFFAQDLPAGVEPPEPDAPGLSPVGQIGHWLHEILTILNVEPKADRCHLVDLAAETITRDGQTIDVTLRYVRGAGPRFRLEVDLRRPLGIRVALGHDGAPWLARPGKAVFRGTLSPSGQPPQPLRGADPQNLLKVQVVAGALTGAAATPTLLEKLADFSEQRANGDRAVRITLKQRARGTGLLVFGPDGKTPKRLAFEAEGVKGTITFRGWAVDGPAQDALFAPPADAPVKPVDEADVYRVFASLFNFVVEMIE